VGAGYMDVVLLRIVVPFLSLLIAFSVGRLLKAPRVVIKRSIIAGVAFALGNFLIDIAAIIFSIWHYDMSGLIVGTPIDLYISAGIIFGFVTSLIFWWLESKNKYLLYTYLLILPFLTTSRDYFGAKYAYTFLVWDSPHYLLFDFFAWVILFTITFSVFRFPTK
jgi:hypothetical protein